MPFHHFHSHLLSFSTPPPTPHTESPYGVRVSYWLFSYYELTYNLCGCGLLATKVHRLHTTLGGGGGWEFGKRLVGCCGRVRRGGAAGGGGGWRGAGRGGARAAAPRPRGGVG